MKAISANGEPIDLCAAKTFALPGGTTWEELPDLEENLRRARRNSIFACGESIWNVYNP